MRPGDERVAVRANHDGTHFAAVAFQCGLARPLGNIPNPAHAQGVDGRIVQVGSRGLPPARLS